MLLAGKVALVSGGARGIGYAIADTFARQGATVVVADIDGVAATQAAEKLGGGCGTVSCDVADESSVTSAVAEVTSGHGRLDILVNNAGVTRDGMIHKMDIEDFRFVVDVHLQGTWLCTREALRHMRSRDGGGVIVNVSSISGKVGNLGQSNYAAAKAAIVALTKTTAREGAPHGVRANAVRPGLIRTAMTEGMPQEVWDDKMSEIPLNRAGEPREVAEAALFLASDMSSYITGVTIDVAGGRHM